MCFIQTHCPSDSVCSLGRYMLSTRTIIELETYLKTEYPDEILECDNCQQASRFVSLAAQLTKSRLSPLGLAVLVTIVVCAYTFIASEQFAAAPAPAQSAKQSGLKSRKSPCTLLERLPSERKTMESDESVLGVEMILTTLTKTWRSNHHRAPRTPPLRNVHREVGRGRAKSWMMMRRTTKMQFYSPPVFI